MIVFTVESGLRGYFAAVYNATTSECLQTGIGSYQTAEEAAVEAIEWAIEEGQHVQAENLNEKFFGVKKVKNVIDEL